MKRLVDTFRKSEMPEQEEDNASLLFDSVKCLKSIVNTWVSFFFHIKLFMSFNNRSFWSEFLRALL